MPSGLKSHLKPHWQQFPHQVVPLAKVKDFVSELYLTERPKLLSAASSAPEATKVPVSNLSPPLINPSVASSLAGMPRLFVSWASSLPNTVKELKLLSVPVPSTVRSTENSSFETVRRNSLSKGDFFSSTQTVLVSLCARLSSPKYLKMSESNHQHLGSNQKQSL